jgi:hypothetical protein
VTVLQDAFRLALVMDLKHCKELVDNKRWQWAADTLDFEDDKLAKAVIENRMQDLASLSERLGRSIDALELKSESSETRKGTDPA